MYDRQTRTEANIHPSIHACTARHITYHLEQRTFSPVPDTYPALSYIHALLTTEVESGVPNETKTTKLGHRHRLQGHAGCLAKTEPRLVCCPAVH
jgi:hypothetical protein